MSVKISSGTSTSISTKNNKARSHHRRLTSALRSINQNTKTIIINIINAFGIFPTVYTIIVDGTTE